MEAIGVNVGSFSLSVTPTNVGSKHFSPKCSPYALKPRCVKYTSDLTTVSTNGQTVDVDPWGRVGSNGIMAMQQQLDSQARTMQCHKQDVIAAKNELKEQAAQLNTLEAQLEISRRIQSGYFRKLEAKAVEPNPVEVLDFTRAINDAPKGACSRLCIKFADVTNACWTWPWSKLRN